MDGKISITGEKPSIKSFEDYDVLSGSKSAPSRDEYKMSTFHNATQEDGDASFNFKADLMGVTGSELFEESTNGRTMTEDKIEAKLEP